jgi:hypothetical protein
MVIERIIISTLLLILKDAIFISAIMLRDERKEMALPYHFHDIDKQHFDLDKNPNFIITVSISASLHCFIASFLIFSLTDITNSYHAAGKQPPQANFVFIVILKIRNSELNFH